MRSLQVALVAVSLLPVLATAQGAPGTATPPGIRFSRPAGSARPASPPPAAPQLPGARPPGSRGPGGGQPFIGDPSFRQSNRRPFIGEPYFANTNRRPFIGEPYFANSGTNARRRFRHEEWPPYLAGGYAIDPYAGYLYPPPDYAEATLDGGLHLLIEPRSARISVDGFFVGTAADLLGSPYALEAGPHRVSVEADGFQAISFDVRIRPGELTTYRRTLAPDAPQMAALPPPVAKTLYVIPRCYAGDKPPVASALPRGCSMAGLRRVEPPRR